MLADPNQRPRGPRVISSIEMIRQAGTDRCNAIIVIDT